MPDVRFQDFISMNDVKFAFRQLLKHPGFTAVAVLVLALGIGANATIFSIINSILVKPLKVRHPEQLVGVYQHERDNPNSFKHFSYLDFADLRSGKDAAFTELFAFRFTSVGLQGDLTERVSACFVSANYFSALGVPPVLGRGFLPEDSSLAGYPEPRMRQLTRTALERLSALPGVESVSAATSIPFGNSWDIRSVQIGGVPPPSKAASALAEGKEAYAIYNVVGADYFRTLGLPLQRGREFEPRETEGDHAPPVTILSQNLADQLWPGQDPLGRTVQFPGSIPTAMTVVGIVPAIPWQVFTKETRPQIYVPLGQDFPASLKLHVRVAPGVSPAQLMTAAREELQRLDPQIPLTEVNTLMALHRDGPTVRVARLGSMLFGVFGVLAMFLSLLGIYGLKAYAVARRTREIGIRMALGANARDVVAMILLESAWLAILGLGLGLLLALAVGKLAGSFLYQVAAVDPLTFSVMPPVLLAMALLACFVPARRAARVDPMEALRYE
jgi:predicted permease